MEQATIRGINILNPVQVDRQYYWNAIDYAVKTGCNHIQINGPIHDPVRGNIDGMVLYRKYSSFNGEKDTEYVTLCMETVNACLEKSHAAGIKTYMWHHELEIPNGFKEQFPQIVNDSGDVEISHPIIRDFLENKLTDFFDAYPLMDGIVLTYVETKVPLLRLKNQKLSSGQIMTYITDILYHTCKKLGKELIVRTFASVEKDYKMLLEAYERVSTEDLIVMDKWTQYDWSLSLPANSFIRNIQKNPLLIEADLFGEFFGKGRLPLMLKNHIRKRVGHCAQFAPVGYCARIDRGGASAFGTANEVNLHIMNAVLNGNDPEEAIRRFFAEEYGAAGEAVKAVMEKTEDIVRRILFANGYYYSELSWFPSLNHCKNHFYFELMREDCHVASDEWFIPVGYNRGPVQRIFDDLNSARIEAADALARVEALKTSLEPEKYRQLSVSFQNLELVSRCWLSMAKVFYHYVRYLDTWDTRHKEALNRALEDLEALDHEGKAALGSEFYCNLRDSHGQRLPGDNIRDFIAEVRESFAYEERTAALRPESCTDFIICGGGCEGHKLQKEVNFSDTLLVNGQLARIPGNKAGMEWSTIVSHGWFSYEIALRPEAENTVSILFGSSTGTLKARITVGEQVFTVDQACDSKCWVELPYPASPGETSTRLRIDKISNDLPLAYIIWVD